MTVSEPQVEKEVGVNQFIYCQIEQRGDPGSRLCSWVSFHVEIIDGDAYGLDNGFTRTPGKAVDTNVVIYGVFPYRQAGVLVVMGWTESGVSRLATVFFLVSFKQGKKMVNGPIDGVKRMSCCDSISHYIRLLRNYLTVWVSAGYNRKRETVSYPHVKGTEELRQELLIFLCSGLHLYPTISLSPFPTAV